MSDPRDGTSYELSDPSCLEKRPLVSVVVLVYNHEQYLAQALDSVLSQVADFPFEVLVGEDCSTDGSRDIAIRYQKAYPGSIRVVTADSNVGATYNLGRMLKAVRGEFVASLDGDDYWLPGKLRQQVAFLRENPGCIAVYANAIAIDKAGKAFGFFNDAGTTCFDLGAILRRGNFLCTSSMMYRTEARPSLLAVIEPTLDYEAHLALARLGMLGHIGQPFVVYRVASAGSQVANDNASVRELYWQSMMRVPRGLVADGDLARGIADFLRRVIFRSISTRSTKLFRSWWPRAVEAAPCGPIGLGMLTAASFLRISWKLLLVAIRSSWGGSSSRVLYPK